MARTLGTARFLVWQTAIVITWIALNVALVALRWDPYPFILLNLAFSTQVAAYAAPLILLAQNRQEARDRAQQENDRQVAAGTNPDRHRVPRANSRSIRLSLPTPPPRARWATISTGSPDATERAELEARRPRAQLAGCRRRLHDR
ncbi:MAG: DUF1003 domain-containing protein [Ilumatobacteraceae bacterium]